MSGEPEEEAREYQMVIQVQLLWKKEGRKGELGLARKNLRQQHSSGQASGKSFCQNHLKALLICSSYDLSFITAATIGTTT